MVGTDLCVQVASFASCHRLVYYLHYRSDL